MHLFINISVHQCTCSSTHLQPRHRRFTGGQPSPLPSDQTADTVSRCSQYHWVRNWGCVSGVETSKRIPVLIADIWTPDFTIEFSMVYHCRIWCHAPPMRMRTPDLSLMLARRLPRTPACRCQLFELLHIRGVRTSLTEDLQTVSWRDTADKCPSINS